jgi:lipopolysaccharide/colanic/teichoic acid biosynthesis glycosyltransferase
MMKFRSMVQNAEKQGTGLFNYEDDPRVTRSGRFLRDHSLDELPQLINILKGDMSIVGPRPCVVYELGDYATLNKRYKKRFEVIAGLTGYAQIQGRNELDWDVKVDFDNQYIDLYKKWGVALDVYIILKTVLNVFHHTDIYEKKIDENISNNLSAELAQNRVVELAHQPD